MADEYTRDSSSEDAKKSTAELNVISKEHSGAGNVHYSTNYVDEFNPQGLREPTEEEAKTLRRILGRASYASYLLCLAELCERASYYSVTELLSNFIQRPLPPGSTTGAPLSHNSDDNAGALGLGLTTASALTLLLTFLAYVVPLFGGYIADTKIGKFKAIWIGVSAGFLSHIFFIIAGSPKVIASGHALAPTIIAILTLCVGTGFIKPNLLPLLMDQYPEQTDVVKTLPSGEKVIVDREKTLERMSLVFYWAINVGSFFELASSYCARRVGWWLAFFIPTIMYLALPFVFFFLNPKLKNDPPAGSVMTDVVKIFYLSFKGNFIKRIYNGTFWTYASPTQIRERGEEFFRKKKPVTWSDQLVLDVKQTVDACKIFSFFVIFNITDGGIGSLATSQAGSMSSKGVPNDLFNNFNPLTIIILIPILDYIIYPTLRKYKIQFRPTYRIFVGFIFGAASQAAGAIIQKRVYDKSPCGKYGATNCGANGKVAPISAWVEVSTYILSAAGECFANTTSYELAYTRAPPKMKGLVMALCLFSQALSAAVSEAVTPVLVDPHLIWAWASMAIIGVVNAVVFLVVFRNLHIVMEKERHIREQLDDQDPTINEKAEALEAVVSIKSNTGR